MTVPKEIGIGKPQIILDESQYIIDLRCEKRTNKMKVNYKLTSVVSNSGDSDVPSDGEQVDSIS